MGAVKPDLKTATSYEIVQAYEAMPEPSDLLAEKAAHILSEWLDDAAPLNERRYRQPARALLRFAALFAVPIEAVPPELATTKLDRKALDAAAAKICDFASYDTPTTLAEDCIRAYLDAIDDRRKRLGAP